MFWKKNNQPVLAEGGTRRWRVGRPKLAAPVPEPLDTPDLTPGETTNTTKTKPVKRSIDILMRFIGGILLITGLMFFGLWLILGLTVMPTILIGDTAWLVQRAPWVEGRAPVGSPVVVLSQPVQRDMLSRLTLLAGMGPLSAITEIAANPGDQVSQAGTTLLVNGTPTNTTIPTTTPIKTQTLGDQYLVVCLTGPCGEPGDVFPINSDQVLGKTIQGFGISGLTGPPTAPGQERSLTAP